LLEGLEISEIALSALERTLRLDSEYFLKTHLLHAKLLEQKHTTTIAASFDISDGNHFSVTNHYVPDGVPYYRGQDAVGHFFIEQSASNSISKTAYDSHLMKRSHLKRGDVLLSIVGSIGEASLVSSERDATCSCKLAILRPRKMQSAYLASFLRGKYGRAQTQRLTRGAIQMSLLLEDMDQVLVPQFSNRFELKIVNITAASKDAIEVSENAIAAIEAVLYQALGLESWVAPEPLTYVQNCKDAFSSGRLDAEFLQPKYAATFDKLSSQFELASLGDLGVVTKGVTVPYSENGSVAIIRSGDLSDISDDSRFLRSNLTEQPFLLKCGDVLISSIGFGSIGKVQVFDKQGSYATVSEVTVVRQNKVNPYYLAAFFRSSVGQMQIERFITGATGQLHLYPRDVAKFWIPVLATGRQLEFESIAKAALAGKERAVALLKVAKNAIEIAIEQDEAAGMAYLARESSTE